MKTTSHGEGRRSDALTRKRILEVAVELLDADGVSGLTFRTLAARLGTGHGALQWHVATKGELLKGATALALARTVDAIDPDQPPRDAIHAIALEVFDTIDAHPWIAGQLAQPPWQATMLRFFELLGRQVQALRVPVAVQLSSTTALLIYIIGAGVQEATTSRSTAALDHRGHVLDTLATDWEGLDPQDYGFTRSVAGQLRVHDDRADFLAGIDFMLTGMIAEPQHAAHKLGSTDDHGVVCASGSENALRGKRIGFV